jgi:C4-dicarboxylate transporter DctQ subunit
MKLDKIVNSGIPIFCGMMLFLMVTLTFVQVVLRNCFGTNINWGDEMTQFSMTWMVLLGMIWATKNNQHINVGIRLHRKFNKKLGYLIDGIFALMLAGAIVVVAYQTAKFALMSMNTESVALRWLKMGYIFFVVPIGMLGICYYYFKNFIQNLVSLFSTRKLQ